MAEKTQPSKPADDRHRHVRQHGHLQKLDVGFGDPVQRGDEVSEKNAEADSACERHEDARG